MDTVRRKIRIEKTPGCVAGTLCVIGDKWTPLIVMELTKGSSRFSLLEQALPGISPRTLSQRLDNLETEKIITKTSHPSVPPRVDYKLTRKGEDLLPIIRSMADWGSKYSS